MQIQQINKSLVTRLKAQMLKKGYNPKTLAERAKVGRSFVYDILNGKSTNPTGSKLSAIADVLDVTVQYLLNGVHPAPDSNNEWSDIVEVQALAVEPTAGGNVVVTVDQPTRPYYFRAGWLKENLRTTPENIRAIFVDGDSMSPTLCADDMILIDISCKNPNPAGLYIIFDGVGIAPKRIELTSPGKVSVRSDNPQYSSYETSSDELDIVGKIVWLAREL